MKTWELEVAVTQRTDTVALHTQRKAEMSPIAPSAHWQLGLSVLCFQVFAGGDGTVFGQVSTSLCLYRRREELRTMLHQHS